MSLNRIHISLLFLMTLSFLAQAGGSLSAAEKDTKGMIDPATPSDIQPAGKTGKAWSLTFSDEFNDGEINTGKWIVRDTRRGNGNHGVTWGWRPASVTEDKEKGRLVISTRRSEEEYSSGCISSKGKFTQKYGYIEARLKAPPANNGHQAAFWMMPETKMIVDGSGKDGAEIDIIETAESYHGSNAVHWDGYKKGEHKSVGKRWKAPDLRDGYHIFAAEWAPEQITFYYDGKPKWVYKGKGIPQVALHLLCSVGIIKFAKGDIRKADLPQQTYFDWVRVYSPKKPAEKPVEKASGRPKENDDNQPHLTKVQSGAGNKVHHNPDSSSQQESSFSVPKG